MKSHVIRVVDDQTVDHYQDIILDILYQDSECIEQVLITLKTNRKIISIGNFPGFAPNTIDNVILDQSQNSKEPPLEVISDEDIEPDNRIEIINPIMAQFYYMLHNCCIRSQRGQLCECHLEEWYIDILKLYQDMVTSENHYINDNHNPLVKPHVL